MLPSNDHYNLPYAFVYTLCYISVPARGEKSSFKTVEVIFIQKVDCDFIAMPFLPYLRASSSATEIMDLLEQAAAHNMNSEKLARDAV